MSEAGPGIDLPVTISVNWEYDSAGEEAATSGLVRYREAAMSMAGSISRLQHTFMLLEMSQIRQTMMTQMMEASVLRVTTAQQRYNAALAEHGEGSKQATAAQAQLRIAILQNQRAQERLNLMQMREYMQIIPMGMSVYRSMISITEALTRARLLSQAAAGPVGWATLGVSLALMGGLAATTYFQNEQQKRDIAETSKLMQTAGAGGFTGAGEPMGFQTGGRAPVTGTYKLHAGEEVRNPEIGSLGPFGGPVMGRGGGDTYYVTINAANAREQAHQFMDEVEREKRRKFPQTTRAY